MIRGPFSACDIQAQFNIIFFHCSLKASLCTSQSKDICFHIHMFIVFPSWEQQELLEDIKSAYTFISRPRGACSLNTVIVVMKENGRWVRTLFIYLSHVHTWPICSIQPSMKLLVIFIWTTDMRYQMFSLSVFYISLGYTLVQSWFFLSFLFICAAFFIFISFHLVLFLVCM